MTKKVEKTTLYRVFFKLCSVTNLWATIPRNVFHKGSINIQSGIEDGNMTQLGARFSDAMHPLKLKFLKRLRLYCISGNS